MKAPSLADRFRHSTNDAFIKIVDLCLSEHVDFLTIGGDTFDGVDRSLSAQILLRNQFERLHKADIPVIIVTGNHDPLSDWIEGIKFSENVHLFAGNQVENISIKKNGNVPATIYGISYKISEVEENLSLKFHSETRDAISIGMLHANVGSRTEHAPYSPCTISDLKSCNMDVWLLGHIHTPEIICREPLILYPGNIQGRHINESGPRGCYLIKVDSDHKISYEFKPVQNIIWKSCDINIENISSLLGLTDILSERCEGELASLTNGEKGIVVRWKLMGFSPLYHELTMPGRIEEIKESLVERFFNQMPFVFSESIRLCVKPVINKQDYTNQENFIGDFLRLSERAKNDNQLKKEILDILNQPLSNRTIRKYIEDINETGLSDILEDSVNMGMDLLSGHK